MFRIAPTPQGLIIPLPTLYTQLMFTAINAITEIGCVSATFVLIGLAECYALTTHRRVRLASHRRYHRVVQVVAMITFIVLEVLISTFTKPHTHHIESKQNCTQVNRTENFLALNDSDERRMSEEMVLYSCLRTNSSNIINISTGVKSEDTGAVQCNQEWIFQYENDRTDHEQFSERDEVGKQCNEQFCTLVSLDRSGTRMFLSKPVPRASFDSDNNKIDGKWTNLNFNVQIDVKIMATKVLGLYEQGVFDELDVRRRLLVQSKKQECQFSSDRKEHSVLPFWLLGLIISMWGTCAFLFILTRVLKRGVFYDIDNPSHWACITDWQLIQGDRRKHSAFLRSTTVDGVRRIFVSFEGRTETSSRSGTAESEDSAEI